MNSQIIFKGSFENEFVKNNRGHFRDSGEFKIAVLAKNSPFIRNSEISAANY